MQKTNGYYRLAMLAVLFVTVVALLLAQTQISFAHSRFKTANIMPDAILNAPPATLNITFTEETSPSLTKITVLDAGGKAVDKGDLKVDGANATLSLGTLADGKYTVKFHTFTEDDSSIIDGQYNFTVSKSASASAGDAAKAAQVESGGDADMPATGLGYTEVASSNLVFEVVGLLAAISMLAGAGLLIAQRRKQ